MRVLLIGVMLLGLAACGQKLPNPECDTNSGFVGSALTCDEAVAAALNALPSDNPAIERIQFLFGSATPCCSFLYPEGEEQPVNGYVVFSYAGGSGRQYVPVVSWHDTITAGTPAAY